MAFTSATCPDSSFFLEYKDENGLRKSCMASHRVGENATGLSKSGPSNHHVPYAVLHLQRVILSNRSSSESVSRDPLLRDR
ncbi:hypothetical protein ACE6H2_014903 [Prunus campanulata]